MSRGLLRFAAGFAVGAGEGMEKMAVQLREDRIRDMQQQFQLQRDDRQNAHAEKMQANSQQFQAGESEKTHSRGLLRDGTQHGYAMERERYSQGAADARAARSDAAAERRGLLTQGAYGTPITGDDGYLYQFNQRGEARQPTTADGQPVRGADKRALSDQDAIRMAIDQAKAQTQRSEYTPPDPEKFNAAMAEALTRMGKPELAGQYGAGAPAAGAQDAPRDPSQRTTGTVYRSPDGRLGRWTGSGWEIVR